MSSNKQALLKAFSEMNIDMLELILDDTRTYSNASKETILRKLGELFESFKKENDTELIPYRGNCASEECKNYKCEGYTFVGNNSNCYSSLVIKETKTDWEDFFCCGEFKTWNTELKLEYEFHYHLRIDEEATFKPSVDVLIKTQKCDRAVGEIMKEKMNYIDKEVYQYWLKEHEDLFESLYFPQNTFRRLTEFWNLYWELKERAAFLIYESEAKIALEEYKLLQHENEVSLLNWLVSYEELGNNLNSTFENYFEDENIIKPGYALVTCVYGNLNIKVSDFKNTVAFKKIYNEHYETMLEKYITISIEELETIDPDSDEYKVAVSLKHQLKIRKMI